MRETTYDYQMVVVANGLTSVYANQTFTTPGSPPAPSDTDTPAMPPWALALLAVAFMGISAIFLGRKGTNPAR